MSSAAPGAHAVRPADVEAWFAELGLEPVERADREAVTSWDLVLDGRRRFDLRITVLHDPSLGVICWGHFAPPINDLFRRAYRRFLRWNDEFPFAKFSVGEDERPMLSVELPIGEVDVDRLGLALARIVGIADHLFDESRGWLWIGGRGPDWSGRTSRNEQFLDRYADRLPELLQDGSADTQGDSGLPPEPTGASRA